MSERTALRFATTGTRLIAGTVVAAAFVAAAVTGISVAWPVVARTPVSLDAVPQAATSVAVCDGALLAIGRQQGAAADITVAVPETVTVGVATDAAAPREALLATPDVSGDSAVPSFSAEPQDGERVPLAAATSADVRQSDLAGFAASACRPPLLESWLVGGSGAGGASDLVVLANPGDVAATVQLTLFGATGETTPAGGTLIVAPRTQRIVPLAGIAFGEESPVIRVTASGAPVQAALQTNITRTLVAGGVDRSGAIPAPERTLVVTGLISAGGDDDDAAASILRLLAPSADTTATITVTQSGANAPASDPMNVPMSAGAPADIDLGALPAGRYTVVVEADEPLVGAVWQTTGFAAGDDFAWFTPADELTEATLFATTAGPPPRLSIANTDAVDAVVRIAATDGSFSSDVEVAAGATVEVSLTARTVYSLDPGAAKVRAGVTYAAAGSLAGYPVWPANAAEQPITVYP